MESGYREGDDLIVNLWRNRGNAVIWSVADFEAHLAKSGAQQAFEGLWTSVKRSIGKAMIVTVQFCYAMQSSLASHLIWHAGSFMQAIKSGANVLLTAGRAQGNHQDETDLKAFSLLPAGAHSHPCLCSRAGTGCWTALDGCWGCRVSTSPRRGL